MRITAFLPMVVLLVGGCAHHQVSRSDLERVSSPAFLSRIEKGAGPHVWVFRGDGSYSKRLGKLAAEEADKRLLSRLKQGMTPFEIADRLRATTVSKLPRESPWSDTVDPARVAEVYQSFLVEEEGVDRPDYSRAREAGADAIVEFVIEEYGMRSRDGKAGAYIAGYGRMFTLEGHQLWTRGFRADGLDSGLPPADPFEVARDPTRWRNTIGPLIDAVAARFAMDLSPNGSLSPREERALQREDSKGADGPPELGADRLPSPTEERPAEQAEGTPAGVDDGSLSPPADK
jgi:hypothetical protein